MSRQLTQEHPNWRTGDLQCPGPGQTGTSPLLYLFLHTQKRSKHFIPRPSSKRAHKRTRTEMLTVLDSSELLSNAICGGLQRPTVYESLSGSCLGCFRRKQIIFSKLLPNAKLSAISTHSGHWSPLIGCLKARCWRQRISTHTSTASLAARAAFSGGKDEATQEEVSDFVTLKNIFFLKFSGNSWFQWPNLLDHPWWWHCNLALSTANIIKMPRVSVLSLFHARSAYTLNLYIHSGKSQGSKKTCSTVYKSF